jgi:probable F420-dependent oxidoreductase
LAERRATRSGIGWTEAAWHNDAVPEAAGEAPINPEPVLSGGGARREAAYGITIPFEGVTLAEHRQWFGQLAELGYTDVWSAEVDGSDGFTPLALAAAWTPSLRLGVAIAPAFTRGPALLAQTAAAMAEAAPGRFAFGLGSSSDVIVARWNGLAYDDPFGRTRDTLRFLRAALAGDKVDHEYPTFTVRGFRLARPVDHPPPLYLAALRPGMLRLAGREADGAILNWLSADDVTTAVAEVGPGKEVVARLFVLPNPDPAVARAFGRRLIATYLNVRAYAEFHRWLGRGPRLEAMWAAWAAGDRKGALAAIPDDVVDELFIHGTPEACRAHVARYVTNGVTVPVLQVFTEGLQLADVVRDLAPRPA